MKPGIASRPSELDDLRVGSDPVADLSDRAHRGDPAVSYGDGFAFGHRRVDRDDLSARQHEIRGLVGRRTASGEQENVPARARATSTESFIR
jgi:hypothetical protein